MVSVAALSRLLCGLLQMATLDLRPGARFGCLRSDEPLLKRAATENAICIIVEVLGRSRVVLEVLTPDGYHLGSGVVEVTELTSSELFNL